MKIKIGNVHMKFKGYKLSIKWILPIFLIILILSFFGINFVKDLTYQNIYKNLAELSEQTATQLNYTITEQKRFIEIMVDSVDRGYFSNEKEIFDNFTEFLDDYNFTRFVIFDKDGNGITSDGFVIENYPNMQEFFAHTDVYLSENRPSTVDSTQVNIYSKKFYLNRKRVTTLCNN